MEETEDETEDSGDGASAEGSDSRAARASNAYDLLSVWDVVPGREADGGVSVTALREWLDAAKSQLEARGRLEIGLQVFGHVLASSPADSDGGWPCAQVRDLLEHEQSETVESGLYIEVLNRRGVTTRGLEDGGKQEQDLVAKYEADAARFQDEAPRSAALLRAIARSYARDARRNEESAQRFRRGVN